MKKAGLKGDPSDYYKVYKKNKMTGQEIRELLFGKTMAGKVVGFPWSIKIFKNGKIETIIFPSDVSRGEAWIEGDALCFRSEVRYDRLKNCAEIYKNPQGNRKKLSEYFRFSDYGLFTFSVEE